MKRLILALTICACVAIPSLFAEDKKADAKECPMKAAAGKKCTKDAAACAVGKGPHLGSKGIDVQEPLDPHHARGQKLLRAVGGCGPISDR